MGGWAKLDWFWSAMSAEGGAKGFFAVDRRSWVGVCNLGLNAAVAYLVMARGTARDNRITTWAVQSIETYTGISRLRARAAVNELIRAGYIRVAVPGAKPRHELLAAHEIRGLPCYRPFVDAKDEVLLARCLPGEAGIAKPMRREKERLARLELMGWVQKKDGRYEAIVPNPEPLWLPNTLIDGAGTEASPIERVRQTQDVTTLRLLVEAYEGHNLRDDGGIQRDYFYLKYEREKIGESGPYVVWGFRRANAWVRWNGFTLTHRREKLTREQTDAGETAGTDFFRRLETLVSLGLIQWVPHLCESDSETAEIIHPLSESPHDPEIERNITNAARLASQALITPAQWQRAYEAGFYLCVPVLKHISKVEVVGIGRLRYRPHTRRTAQWWAELNQQGEVYVSKYNELIDARAASMVFKEASMGLQR